MSPGEAPRRPGTNAGASLFRGLCAAETVSWKRGNAALRETARRSCAGVMTHVVGHDDGAAPASGTRRPWAGRGGTFVTNIGITSVATVLAVALAAPPPLHAQADPSWVGKRVVQKLSNFTLRQNGETAPRTESLIRVYVVERVFGPTVWLHTEGNGPTGWAPGDQVAPIDQAIEFFTNEVRANPRDAFSYVMRGRVWRDRREIDKAMADYTAAIGLDPRAPRPISTAAMPGPRSWIMTRPSPTSPRPSGSTPRTPMPLRGAVGTGAKRRSTTRPSPTSMRPSGSNPETPLLTFAAASPGIARTKGAIPKSGDQRTIVTCFSNNGLHRLIALPS